MRLQGFGQGSHAGFGGLQSADEDANHRQGLQTGRHRRAVLRGIRRREVALTGLLLLLLAACVGGGIHGLPTESEVSQASLTEQLAEVIVHTRADPFLQLMHRTALRRLFHEMHQRLRQLAQPRETNPLIVPQAEFVELRNVLERDEGGVVIEAGVVADLGEGALDGLQGELELGRQLGPLRHLAPPEALHDLVFARRKFHCCPVI